MIPFAFATGNCGCPLALLRTDSFALPRACPSGTALRSVCTFPRCLVLRSFSQAFPRLFPLGRSLRRYRRYPVPQSLPALPEARSRSGACLPWVLRQLFAACSPDPPALCLRFHRVAPRSAIAHASQAPLASSAAWGKFPCPLNSALSFPSLVPSLGNIPASLCCRFTFFRHRRGEPVHPDNRTTSTSILISPAFLPVSSLVSPKSSPRPISTAKLHMLPCFHRRPIYPVVSRGPYFLLGMGTLFLRGASRLDAFSVYPVRTSLPCYAVGTTTVAPVVRPLRSSRTRSSSSHDSYAHDG